MEYRLSVQYKTNIIKLFFSRALSILFSSIENPNLFYITSNKKILRNKSPRQDNIIITK